MSIYKSVSQSSSPSTHARRRTRSIESAASARNVPYDSTVLSDLPEAHQFCFFKDMPQIKRACQRVVNEFEETKNEYLVVYHLPQEIMEQIDNSYRSLGVSFRFMFCTRDRLGILKIMPGLEHNCCTRGLSDQITDVLTGMGVALDRMHWGMSATHQGRDCCKQLDDQLLPSSRLPAGQRHYRTPTLVIETGVSESLKKLRFDAGWWLTNTNGGVNIVLVVSIKLGQTRKVQLEKWQMVARTTRTRQSVTPQAVQTIHITQNNVNGAPLVLGFADLMERPPNPPECDVSISAADLIKSFRILWCCAEKDPLDTHATSEFKRGIYHRR